MAVTDWPVDTDPVFKCWLWTGTLDKRTGIGLVWRGKQPSSAYRVVYEAEVGPVPEGLELDHLCRRRLCVNPAHLEPVTRRENELRKSFAYRNRKLLKCKEGHCMKANGARTHEGGRVCRLCS